MIQKLYFEKHYFSYFSEISHNFKNSIKLACTPSPVSAPESPNRDNCMAFRTWILPSGAGCPTQCRVFYNTGTYPQNGRQPQNTPTTLPNEYGSWAGNMARATLAQILRVRLTTTEIPAAVCASVFSPISCLFLFNNLGSTCHPSEKMKPPSIHIRW